MDRLSKRHAVMAASALSALALVGASGPALAQEESPATQADEARDEMAAMGHAHPLHIHSGTCSQLGDVVFPLGEISPELMVHGEAAGDDMVGSMTEQDVHLNVTVVAATIDAVTGEDHAINIHQSEEAMAEYIACGDIGGTRFDGDKLVIRLSPLNDSGYVGFALLQEGDDGNTTVYSMLTETDEPNRTAEEPAAEESIEPAAEEPSLEPAAEEPSMEPAAEESMEPAADEPSLEPAADDTADDSSEPDVTVEVTVDDDENVDVEVEEGAESSPAP